MYLNVMNAIPTFEELLEMEKRLISRATQILMCHPGAHKVTWACGKGLRSSNDTADGILDTLGVDGVLELFSGAKLTTQFKCGTRENYEKWGKPRHSFLLGPANDIYCERYKDICVKQPQIVISAYESEPGQIDNYVLISWCLLIRRVAAGKIQIFKEKNSRDGRKFCWAQDRQLLRSRVVIDNIIKNDFI